MGIWSEPLGAWPMGLRYPNHRLSVATKQKLWHCCGMFDGELSNVDASGDERKQGDATASLDALMASVCDTAKLLGYFTPPKQAAWLELLSVVARHNTEDPRVATQGISLFFYCRDFDVVFALHYSPRNPEQLFLRTSTVNMEEPEPDDAAGVAQWRAAKLWTEPTEEQLADDDHRGRVDVRQVRASLEADLSFGAPTGHLWLELMRNPRRPKRLPGYPPWPMLWPAWTPAKSIDAAADADAET